MKIINAGNGMGGKLTIFGPKPRRSPGHPTRYCPHIMLKPSLLWDLCALGDELSFDFYRRVHIKKGCSSTLSTPSS
jgi:hypothetical protein